MARLRLPLPHWYQGVPLAQVLLLGALVAAMAELKVNPFGTTFRFGLGPPALVFGMLIWRRIPGPAGGFAAALFVVALRSAITLAWPGEQPPALDTLIQQHGPAAVYYVVLGFLCRPLQAPKLIRKPFLLTGLIAAADVAANLSEAALRGMWVASWPVLQPILTVAGVRTAVVSGLFFIGQQQVSEWRLREKQRQYGRLLTFLIDLRTEVFFLQKSAAGIEEIMAQSYSMYANAPDQAWAERALNVAKEVHELKKDNQRIVASMEQILRRRELPASMRFSDVLALVTEANQAYARKLKKEVQITCTARCDFDMEDYSHWVSILNNLVSNAIEAMGWVGTVVIGAEPAGDRFSITVVDDGPGIRARDPELVFQPGYTTKVNQATGRYSAGLGLAHVRSLVHDLGGEVRIEQTGPEGTVFSISFPMQRVVGARQR